jgi:Transcriptional activator of glycolytic enzymes
MLGVNATFANVTQQVEQHFRIVNRNLARIHVQPPRMANLEQRQQNMLRQEVVAQEVREPAELSPNPKTLYDLWTEYQHGIGGRKRARDFTPTERGRCKKTYSRRKVVWVMIDHLLRSRPNTTIQSNIDAILDCYGRNLPVTQIIDGLVRDRRTGGHPNLR